MLRRWRTTPGAALFVATLALFTDSLVFSLIVPVLPYYLGPAEAASQSSVGALFFAYAAALLVATPVFGALVDRVGCRAPMLAGLAGVALTTLLFAVVKGHWALVATRALQGAACAATATASLALIAQAYPPEGRGKAMGAATAGNAVGSLVGPPLGGALFQAWGPLAPLVFAAGLAALDGVARALLVTPGGRGEASRIGLRSLLRQPAVLDVVVIVVLGASALTSLEAALPLHLATRFGARPLTTGLCFAVATIAFGISTPVVGALEARLGRLRAAVAGLFVVAAALPCVALASSLPAVFVAMALAGIAVGLSITPTMPALADAVDVRGGSSYGAAYAVFNASWAIGMMAGPLAASVLTDAFGFRAALLSAAAVILTAAVVLRILRGLHARPAPAPQPAPGLGP
jgi:MFS transporter, DHA1 family, solute carrier family 18 (vesicular amine transporter), member 1/2